MDHRVIKQQQRTLKSSSNQSFSSLIHSDQEATTSVFYAKDGNGLIRHTQSKFQPTQTSDMLPTRYLNQQRVKSHGMELSKNTLFYKLKTDLPQDHMDGQMLVIQDNKVHSIVQLVEMYASEEQLPMHTTSVVFLLDLIFQEQTLKLCQANGNSKLDQLLVSKQAITFGPQDIFSLNVLRSTTSQSALSQNCSQTGMVPDVTPTFQQRL